MQVTIVPRPVRLVNHSFMTCTDRTSRTSRVKPFTGRICSTVLDKDECNSCGYTHLLPGVHVTLWVIALGWDQFGFPVRFSVPVPNDYPRSTFDVAVF